MLPGGEGRGGGETLLEEIQEEEIPDIELEEMDTASRDRGTQLKTSTLEPS